MRPIHLNARYNAATSNSNSNPGFTLKAVHRLRIRLNAGLLVTLIAIALVAAVLYFGLSQAQASNAKPADATPPRLTGRSIARYFR